MQYRFMRSFSFSTPGRCMEVRNRCTDIRKEARLAMTSKKALQNIPGKIKKIIYHRACIPYCVQSIPIEKPYPSPLNSGIAKMTGCAMLQNPQKNSASSDKKSELNPDAIKLESGCTFLLSRYPPSTVCSADNTGSLLYRTNTAPIHTPATNAIARAICNGRFLQYAPNDVSLDGYGCWEK